MEDTDLEAEEGFPAEGVVLGVACWLLGVACWLRAFEGGAWLFLLLQEQSTDRMKTTCSTAQIH